MNDYLPAARGRRIAYRPYEVHKSDGKDAPTKVSSNKALTLIVLTFVVIALVAVLQFTLPLKEQTVLAPPLFQGFVAGFFAGSALRALSTFLMDETKGQVCDKNEGRTHVRAALIGVLAMLATAGRKWHGGLDRRSIPNLEVTALGMVMGALASHFVDMDNPIGYWALVTAAMVVVPSIIFSFPEFGGNLITSFSVFAGLLVLLLVIYLVSRVMK